MSPRLGYRIVKGRYRRHPTEGPIVTELYARYVAGTGVVALTHWLAELGILSRVTGRRWSPRGLQLMMASGFPAGLLHVGAGHVPGAHAALISQEVWESYIRCRAERWAGSTIRMGAPPTGLQGLVFCGTCGRQLRLKDEWSTTGVRMRGYLYCCGSGSACALRASITRRGLEKQVRHWVSQLADESARAAGASSAALPSTRQLRRLAEGWSEFDPAALNVAVAKLISRVVIVRQPGRRQRRVEIHARWDEDLSLTPGTTSEVPR